MIQPSPADHRLGERAFLLQQAAIRSSKRALGDEPVHLDGPVLADPVRAVGGLVLDRRVPPAVVVDHVASRGSD